jgi:hypothetical protein
MFRDFSPETADRETAVVRSLFLTIIAGGDWGPQSRSRTDPGLSLRAGEARQGLTARGNLASRPSRRRLARLAFGQCRRGFAAGALCYDGFWF